MDVISIVLSMVALSALVYSIKHVASEGPDAWALATLAVAIVSGWQFVRRQLHLPTP